MFFPSEITVAVKADIHLNTNGVTGSTIFRSLQNWEGILYALYELKI